MELRFVFKNMETSPAMEERCRETIVRRAMKIANDLIETHITFAQEHDSHILHCKIIDSHGKSFFVKEEGDDMYKCIDETSHKIERILRKEKNKHVTHKSFRENEPLIAEHENDDNAN